MNWNEWVWTRTCLPSMFKLVRTSKIQKESSLYAMVERTRKGWEAERTASKREFFRNGTKIYRSTTVFGKGRKWSRLFFGEEFCSLCSVRKRKELEPVNVRVFINRTRAVVQYEIRSLQRKVGGGNSLQRDDEGRRIKKGGETLVTRGAGEKGGVEGVRVRNSRS